MLPSVVFSAGILIALVLMQSEGAPCGEPAWHEPSLDEIHAVHYIVASHEDVGAAVLDCGGVAFYPNRMMGCERFSSMVPARSPRGVPLRTVCGESAPLTSGSWNRVLYRTLRPFSRSTPCFRVLLAGDGLDGREALIRGMGAAGLGMDYWWHGAERCTLVGVGPAAAGDSLGERSVTLLKAWLSEHPVPRNICVMLHDPYRDELWCLKGGEWVPVSGVSSEAFGGGARRPMDYPVWGKWPMAPGGAGGHVSVSFSPPA